MGKLAKDPLSKLNYANSQKFESIGHIATIYDSPLPHPFLILFDPKVYNNTKKPPPQSSTILYHTFNTNFKENQNQKRGNPIKYISKKLHCKKTFPPKDPINLDFPAKLQRFFVKSGVWKPFSSQAFHIFYNGSCFTTIFFFTLQNFIFSSFFTNS